jgi:hypothetical protein
MKDLIKILFNILKKEPLYALDYGKDMIIGNKTYIFALARATKKTSKKVFNTINILKLSSEIVNKKELIVKLKKKKT